MTTRGRHWGCACTALLLTGLLAACAGDGGERRRGDAREVMPAAGAGAIESIATPRRSDRGNPPFYDVLGKRYHVLPSSLGYVERGVASWYGRNFHGLATSSGETYDMHGMTAAHTTLPLPTWAEVTNLANGKRVVVKINDRGPFVDNRLIDLSYAAAIALDMVGPGTARVEVRAMTGPQMPLSSDASAFAPAPTTPSAVAPLQAVDRMFVQVGAFSQQDNAARLVARLRASGFTNPTVLSEPDGRRMLHRVRLGPINDAGEFDALSARLLSIGVAGSRLGVDRTP
ncbi:MAG TPA: septal ring lytic transglycosylase RlpA family protein [Gammaproteobacteria bacterium]|nr:septal ring lytic transglycosylase RlpA family protein [Gammaproteobacteria bacterium]